MLRAWKVLETDRPLFSPEIWQRLPKLMEDLIHRERIRVCVFEDRDTPGEILTLGVASFVYPEFLEGAMESGRGLADSAFAAESNGHAVFLNLKQVAEANRREDLRSLTFFGGPAHLHLNDPTMLISAGIIAEGWTFFHRGFGLREIWFEPISPFLIDSMVRTGVRQLGERVLPDGNIAKVFRMTRSEAVELAPSWPAIMMFAPPPRFGFSRVEQQLLERALLDLSDREAAEEMRVSTDAIKKRWRSIYKKVSQIEAALLPRELNGSDRRRALLQNVRTNLQEIRPY